MGRRKIEDRNVRKLSKIGGSSTGVTIPVDILRELKWREKQKVIVKRRGRQIIIEDWPARQ